MSATEQKTETHTPGPWHVDPMGLSVYATDPYRHGAMKVLDVRGWGHLTGAGACQLPEADAIAIQKANGAIAAAAPDLLAACRKFVDSFKSLQREKCDVAHRMAIAAIAKAEGR